jgi:hypothetical protein
MAATRVPVSDEIAHQLSRRIATFAAASPDTLRWLVPYVRQFGGLPLYVGWTQTIGIRPDGELIEWSTEGDYEGSRPVSDATWIIIALVTGAERYPELRSLLPVRDTDAIDCPCRSNPLFAPGQIICGECFGLGWLPRTNLRS